jgi:uncharacterized coiled-coil protein SlyX
MPDRPKRFQSQTERDIEGSAAARERATAEAERERLDRSEHTTPVEIPVPVYEDVTGQYEGEDLERMRERRHPTDRVRHLEKRADKQDDKIDKIRDGLSDVKETLGKVSGKIDVLPDLIKQIGETAGRAAQQQQVTFTAQVDTQKAQVIGETRLAVAEKLDVIDQRKQKRTRRTRLVGAVAGLLAGGATLWEAIKHAVDWLASR